MLEILARKNEVTRSVLDTSHVGASITNPLNVGGQRLRARSVVLQANVVRNVAVALRDPLEIPNTGASSAKEDLGALRHLAQKSASAPVQQHCHVYRCHY